jgi:hypothetical protein
MRQKAIGLDNASVAQSLNNLAVLTTTRPATLKPSRSTSDLWRYTRKPLAPTIPTSLSR